jgi:hypothetical protein
MVTSRASYSAILQLFQQQRLGAISAMVLIENKTYQITIKVTAIKSGETATKHNCHPVFYIEPIGSKR